MSEERWQLVLTKDEFDYWFYERAYPDKLEVAIPGVCMECCRREIERCFGCALEYWERHPGTVGL